VSFCVSLNNFSKYDNTKPPYPTWVSY